MILEKPQLSADHKTANCFSTRALKKEWIG
ncbi:hypothetical protein LCGC14_2065010, partial [marine sediment metagenome]